MSTIRLDLRRWLLCLIVVGAHSALIAAHLLAGGTP